MTKTLVIAGPLAFVLVVSLSQPSAQEAPGRLSSKEQLGKKLFLDKDLSAPAGQACAACHGPSVGFTGPDEAVNRTGGVYEGAVKGRFGNRKPPSAAYAGGSPRLSGEEGGRFTGGMFWDGRATGDTLQDPLAEQALGPFLNPLEQNMPDKKAIILAVRNSDYAGLFETVWGPGSLSADADADLTYARIGRSIAAYERSSEVNPFSSKFDDFWRAASAKGLKVAAIDAASIKAFEGMGLSGDELRGLVLFNTKGKCATCHVLSSQDGRPPAFTDYGYENLGIPRNPENPFYKQDKAYNADGDAWVDRGLGSFLETVAEHREHAASNMGKHKVPTLRNVDLRPTPGFAKCYGHNGYFKSLRDVVRFYNTRDNPAARWPAPEVVANLNKADMGDLGLTGDEEDAIVTFLGALSDRR